MIDLLEESAVLLDLQKVSCSKQVHARSVGTPDMSVVMEGKLLVGHVELNAPGKGSHPRDFTGGHDTAQFKYYSALPNLLCTDGRSFSLWRDGELVGKRVSFYGNPLVDGENAVQDGDGDYLEPLLRSFLEWTPTTLRNPEKLAKLLAPSSRYLCEAVEGVLKRGDTALSSLKNDWCTYLTPDATDRDFADAYAQTVTFGLLLARLAGAHNLGSRDEVASALGVAHPLLATAIRNALDPDLRSKNDLGDLGPPLDILIRFLEVVEPAQLTDERDLWIHFYEDYLAAYDPKLRSARGVYYTPKEVVEAQVRLVAELLQERFDCRLGFADDKVTTLDPACGTGTYLIEVLNEIEKETEAVSGRGAVPRKVVEAAKRIYGFEILVGSYTVAHLNLARKFASVTPENTSGPPVQVYLTDTLESPVALPPGHLPLPYQDLGEEHERALKVKADASILVCIGNPPYDRENQETASSTRRKGGWVRYGDAGSKEKPILEDFLAPLRDSGGGGHAKNLYNDYVYFWRWALWKITKTNPAKGGIVSFITPSSYLAGPGFVGMRQVMREVFDEIWIIDLGGEGRGANTEENVFAAIRTPVTIAIGVRLPGREDRENPSSAQVRYLRITGSAKEKLVQLAKITLESSDWQNSPSDGSAPFLPSSGPAWESYPLLTALFPWQTSGVQVKRTWPIATNKDVLIDRWKVLVSSGLPSRASLLKETASRRLISRPQSLWTAEALPSLSSITSDGHEPIVPYAYRSFDRRCLLADARLIDRPRRELWAAHSDRQVYLTSLLNGQLGK
jgi:hypothetical protein